jgi:hypothetical protein
VAEFTISYLMRSFSVSILLYHCEIYSVRSFPFYAHFLADADSIDFPQYVAQAENSVENSDIGNNQANVGTIESGESITKVESNALDPILPVPTSPPHPVAVENTVGMVDSVSAIDLMEETLFTPSSSSKGVLLIRSDLADRRSIYN